MKATLKTPEGRLEVSFSEGDSLIAILLENGLHPDSLVVFLDGVCVPEDSLMVDSAEYEVVIVASGG